MLLRPCPSGCGFYLSSNDRHDRCIQCLGREHADAAFAEGAKAYTASGQAASALHAMAILQVYQAKVLKDLHEGVPDPELLQELRSATDYALQATKVTTQALGRALSTMVVQERHLWLNLAEMQDAEKVCFLDAPISQAGLFGETVEEFAQQFSTVKKETEAIKHILPPRVVSASPAPPRQQPPPAPRRGRPPAQEAGTASLSTCHKEPSSGFKAFLRLAAQGRRIV
ncbi:hypothetical protein M9458_053331 [Cirrhinus mrigala]|uniref:Uncharacterized protein n=1 Tax=Cirrhinus mrigala TaxID=683832 RepID=A0ABD0MML2_CIRMR